MPFKFPYTNFQELNLDWIIKKVKDLSKQIEDDSSIVSEYIDRLIAVEDKADNAEATATAADARATGANTTANSALTLATQAKQTAEIADLSTTLLGLKIGDLSSLYTTAKDTIVNAINEVWSIFHNATAVTNVTPAGTDPAVTYSNGVFTFDLPEGGDPDAVTHAELDAAIDDVEDRIDGLEDSINDLSEELDNKADVIIDTVSGDIASFPDGTATPLKALIVNVEPVQAGTGDPSPSNVRPVSGWAGLEVTRTGKNIYNPSETPVLLDCYTSIGIAQRRNGYYYKLPQGTYSIHADLLEASAYIYGNIINKDGSYSDFFYIVAGTPSQQGINKTLTEGQYFAIFDQQSDLEGGSTKFSNVNLQIELGSTATAFEEYSGNSFPVTFGETVYGGSIDLINGTLIIDAAFVDLGTLSYTYYSDYDTFVVFLENKAIGEPPDYGKGMVCSAYPTSEYIWYSGYKPDKSIGGTDGKGIAIKDSSYTNVPDFKAAMDGVQLVYPLETPISIQLTPQQIDALKGYNNIWSDAGAVAVTYRADTKGYIDKLIAQVQALALGG